MEFTDSSNDVLVEIMKYLSARDLLSLRRTCHKLRHLSMRESVWIYFLNRDYGLEKHPIFEFNISAEDIYKQERKFDPEIYNVEFVFEGICFDDLPVDVQRGLEEKFNTDEFVGLHFNPLRHFSLTGRDDLVWLFVICGADVNAVDRFGNNALMIASYQGHEEVVDILQESTIDINHTNDDGKTALMFAKQNKHFYIIEMLNSPKIDYLVE